MSTSTMELAPSTRSKETEAERSGHGRPSRLTLEDLVLGAWEDLVAHGRAECPVCGGGLEPTACSGCGSRLS